MEQANKLSSFRVQTPFVSYVRAGALYVHSIVDLNMACARLLADQSEAQPARLAHAMVPATMLELLEGGPSAIARARQAFEHAISLGEAARGPAGETVVYRPEQVRFLAPLPNPTSLRDFIAFEERSEEHTSELQSRGHLVCRLLLEKKKKVRYTVYSSDIHTSLSSLF